MGTRIAAAYVIPAWFVQATIPYAMLNMDTIALVKPILNVFRESVGYPPPPASSACVLE
jgi:hypothetical protein